MSGGPLRYERRGGKTLETVPIVDPLVLRVMGINPKKRDSQDAHHGKRPGKNVLDDAVVMQIRAVMKFTSLRKAQIMERFGLKNNRYNSIRDWITYANLREPLASDLPEWAIEFAL